MLLRPTGAWTSGMFGCSSDWWTFGKACVCPCAVLWDNATNVSTPLTNPCCEQVPLTPWAVSAIYGVTFSAVVAGMCCTSCIHWDCLPVLMLGHFCSACAHQPVREAVRKKYGISPGGQCKCPDARCDDYCTVLLCYSCAMTQEHTQVKITVPGDSRAPMTVDSMRLPMTME